MKNKKVISRSGRVPKFIEILREFLKVLPNLIFSSFCRVLPILLPNEIVEMIFNYAQYDPVYLFHEEELCLKEISLKEELLNSLKNVVPMTRDLKKPLRMSMPRTF